MTKPILLFLALAGCVPSFAQVPPIPADTPPVVVRRISQALWPDQLFDSIGHPQAAFAPFGGAPDRASLFIAKSDAQVDRLPGATFYAGSAAYGCFDCGIMRVAAVVRGDTSITLRGPEDLQKLAIQLGARFVPGDSVGLRTFVVQALSASCLVGCGARWLPPGEALARVDSALASPVDDPGGDWKRPRTFVISTADRMEVHFLVIAPSEGIWRVVVTQGLLRPHLEIEMRQSARLGLWP